MGDMNETVQTKLYDAIKSVVDDVTSEIDWYQILRDQASFEQAAQDAVKEALDNADVERRIEDAISEVDIEQKVEDEVDGVDFEDLAREAIADVSVDEIIEDAIDSRLDSFERKLKLADPSGLSDRVKALETRSGIDVLSPLTERVGSLELRLNALAGLANKQEQRIAELEDALRKAAVEFSVVGRRVE